MSQGLEILREAGACRRRVTSWRAGGHSIGLVPTMGALHAGHLALVTEARRLAGRVIVSIFVNPTQFGPNEDFDRYPRTFDEDCELLAQAGVDAVFAPSVDDMYPPGDATRVSVGRLSDRMCGAHREGHFDGVATIVTKLLLLTAPAFAVFGKKDYQQLQIIRRLVRDLYIPTRIVGHPIVRETDGLALSSRNRYLSSEDRARALAVPRSLAVVVEAHARGEHDAGALRTLCESELSKSADRVDYVAVANAESLEPLQGDIGSGPALVAVAAHFGATRLIDNVVLGEDGPPGLNPVETGAVG